MATKYSSGKIYKLTNTVDDRVYVGSTVYPLNERLSCHKIAACKRGNQKVYAHFNSIGWDNVRIELLEAYPCGSNTELIARERYWYDTVNPMLNTNRPHVTVEEISEGWRVKSREYYAANREQRIAYRHEYYAANREKCHAEMCEYRAEHREKRNAANREHGSKPWTCTVCDITCRTDNKSQHLRTSKHLLRLAASKTSTSA